MKRNRFLFQTIHKSIIQFIHALMYWLVSHTAGLVMGLPYLTWRTCFPKRRYGSHPWSRFLRRVFENRKTRRIIGIHLTSIVLGLIFIQYPVAATEMLPETSNTTVFIESLSSRPVVDTVPRFRAPVPGYLSQPFHAYHPGVDIAGNDYRLVYPISHGKIVMIEQSLGGYGLSVMVDHGNGLFSRYAHLDHISVELNQKVTLETALGSVGSTGWTTGAHLHLEVYDNGIAIDPLTMFENPYSTQYTNVAIAPNPTEAISTPSAIMAATAVVDGNIPTLEATISAMTIKVYASGFVEPQAYTASPSAIVIDPLPEVTNP